MNEIMQAISAVKAAIDIAKAINSVDLNLEKAELRLKIAELMVSLADIKLSLLDAQELLLKKNDEIRELNQRLLFQKELIRKKQAYYEKDENGQPTGDPYCPHCFESKEIGIHLIVSTKGTYEHICPSCKHVFPTMVVK